MKFSLSWLKEHLDTRETLETLVEGMTMAGLEVEDVDDPAARLADFTVAHVLKAEPHPDADRLRVCTVATKDGEKQIVCGAPNARAGMTAVYAALGTYIPGLSMALDAKPRAIRGVESHGMLCSAKELEAGEDHDGILDLTGDWAVGTPAADAMGLNDPVIDFEVTPNRPDWLGVVGIARDLAAAGHGRFKEPYVEPTPGTFPCPVAIEIDAPKACPVFAGRLIRGVKNGPSPDWLRQRLESIGLRPINALVDVTNFISYERARPLHVYDAAKLTGPIRARMGKTGEAFRALDDKDYAVDETMVVIADDARVLGLGGVMGGVDSGCTEETTDVFIEAAFFDPTLIAKTGRATGILSDAQYRFARGVDPHSVHDGIERAAQLILEICGGEPSEVLLSGEVPPPPPAVELDPADVHRITGLDVPNAGIQEVLERIGCTIVPHDGPHFRVEPPTWRGDIAQAADLVEEVARLVGYDQLPAKPLPRPAGRRAPALTARQRRVSAARRTLASRGLHEAITWSFCRRDQAELFGGGREDLTLVNPISSELDVMRPSALIHLLVAAQKNADRGFPDAALFEVGPIYLGPGHDEQHRVAAGVRAGGLARHWTGARQPDVFDVKADALAVLQAAGVSVENLQTAAPARDWWHPGRSGVLQMGPKLKLAEFGEIHPRVLRALDVDGPVVAFEADLSLIPEPRAKAGAARPAFRAPDLMPLTRDFAFIVDEDTPAADLVKAAKGAEKALIVGVDVFDVFEGEAVGAGKKSVAIEVTLQPIEKTLDDKAIEAVSDKVVAAVAKATGGELRG